MSKEHVEHIKFHRIRPRIHLETHFSPDQLCAVFSEKLESNEFKIEGTVLSNFLSISPVKQDQHYWSPQLTVTIEETENGSLIRGLYGPKPNVWTMFIFIYAVIGFTTFITLMIGLSYMSLGKGTAILWLVPLFTLLFLTLYLVAYLGQKFGQRQMIFLHNFMEECVGEKIEPI